jgi:hypothetical protein
MTLLLNLLQDCGQLSLSRKSLAPAALALALTSPSPIPTHPFAPPEYTPALPLAWGNTHGRLLRPVVPVPNKWKATPLSKVLFTFKSGLDTWKSVLELKTHYVYSMTAAGALSRGTENGLFVMRSIDSVQKRGPKRRVVTFSCSSLIIGNGWSTSKARANSSKQKAFHLYAARDQGSLASKA